MAILSMVTHENHVDTAQDGAVVGDGRSARQRSHAVRNGVDGPPEQGQLDAVVGQEPGRGDAHRPRAPVHPCTTVGALLPTTSLLVQRRDARAGRHVRQLCLPLHRQEGHAGDGRGSQRGRPDDEGPTPPSWTRWRSRSRSSQTHLGAGERSDDLHRTGRHGGIGPLPAGVPRQRRTHYLFVANQSFFMGPPLSSESSSSQPLIRSKPSSRA